MRIFILILNILFLIGCYQDTDNITYTVTGTSNDVDISFVTDRGTILIEGVALPFQKEYDDIDLSCGYYLAVENYDPSGTVLIKMRINDDIYTDSCSGLCSIYVKTDNIIIE